jgi:hypothetical protein
MAKIKASTTLVGKYKGKKTLGRHRNKWKNNTKLILGK